MSTLSTIKYRGLRQYEELAQSNINLASNGFDILSNGHGLDEPRYPCSGNGLDGALVHEGIITDDGEVPTYSAGGNEYDARIVDALGINSVQTNMAYGEGSAVDTFGELFANSWIEVSKSKGEPGEIMWISSISSPVLTVVRGQQGTSARNHDKDGYIRTLGLSPNVLTEAFKVPCGYWKAVKCITSNMEAGTVNVQINGGKYDDIVNTSPLHAPESYTPNTADLFVQMVPGEIIYGNFNRVAIDEPPTELLPELENVAKLMLIRG